MDIVGAGLRDDVDDGAGIAAEVGGVQVGLDLELADSFDSRAEDDELVRRSLLSTPS